MSSHGSPEYKSLITAGLRSMLAKDKRDFSNDDLSSLNIDKRPTPEATILAVREVLTFSAESHATVRDSTSPFALQRPVVQSHRPKRKQSEAVLLTLPRVSNPEHTIVHKGFGKFKLEQEHTIIEGRPPLFPPLPNVVYDSLNQRLYTSMPPKFIPQFDGAAFVKEYLVEKSAEGERYAEQDLETLGELTAQNIDWSRPFYDNGERGSSASSITISLCRKDFVAAIDNAERLGHPPFSLCEVCGKNHIPRGPPIVMQDLDPCFSNLPRWFPIDKHEKPWNTFIEFMNSIVRDAEREQGRIRDPNKVSWNKEYHESTPEWRAVGRYGGWWKCRTGKENMPMVERECELCHRPKTQEEIDRESKVHEDEMGKTKRSEWIKQCMRQEMEKDRAFMEARIQCEG